MPPPLPPTTQGGQLTPAGNSIVVEMFHDLICPFSSKMYKTVYDSVIPAFGDSVTFVVHQVPQPWHPQGSYVHEAALAVRYTTPGLYGKFCRAAFAAYDSGSFTDADTWNKTREQIYEELCTLVSEVGGDAPAVRQLLAMKEGGCNEMTQHIKWAVKLHRCRGVHVTPTVHVNGLEAGIVSSGWTGDQWKAFLEPMGADFFQGSKLA